ncbi:hypothetical protein GXM_10199 [Nostoc sphaeroides CCNUC1]|uniref:Uncharacterized protein n=1 Tax=Nostoc sphaeroides CCNUC1 TaxID=2653204 RepID=A0A5P8WJC0_9NOSO|nr:hypothetical protein GXM_10199 [Nostoc sphaeroides CCNUC1]
MNDCNFRHSKAYKQNGWREYQFSQSVELERLVVAAHLEEDLI